MVITSTEMHSKITIFTAKYLNFEHLKNVISKILIISQTLNRKQFSQPKICNKISDNYVRDSKYTNGNSTAATFSLFQPLARANPFIGSLP